MSIQLRHGSQLGLFPLCMVLRAVLAVGGRRGGVLKHHFKLQEGCGDAAWPLASQTWCRVRCLPSIDPSASSAVPFGSGYHCTSPLQGGWRSSSASPILPPFYCLPARPLCS